ncbi:ATP-binding protein [Streptacidiphilus carbonis]|jgi:anti-sigma regulatory factor (Ser/Thr protein kinase)|uniref:ATP-binding protein n=1 Tax=Streptacidiphilus carbonis TaxID=105422 RepID=UPI000694CD70|nr:ATP-binding protein [Streptacidiphilus carbonis]
MTNRRAWAAIASFPPHPQNVRHARRITRTALAAWGADDLVDSAETVVSELVTNALVYGRGPVDLTLALTGRHLRIAVTDEGTSLPVAREAAEDAQSGRGLSIVGMLVESWEVVVRLTGKTVTCVLAVQPSAVDGLEGVREPDLADARLPEPAVVGGTQRRRVRPSGEHGA